MSLSRVPPCWLKIGAGVVGGLVLLHCIVGRLRKKDRYGRRRTAPGIVTLHIFPRGTKTPNLAPFAVKVETFLRMTNIPYEPCFDTPLSVKGKCPWISYNDDDIADSSFCLEYLKNNFNVDLDSHLNAEQKAIAYAFKIMIEEYLDWCTLMYRWIYKAPPGVPVPVLTNLPAPYGLPFSLYLPLLRRRKIKSAFYQGIGRHSPEEVAFITEKILRSLSTFLGGKRYLMGDKPSEIDCTLFAFLVQAIWNLPESPFDTLVNGELTNLKRYTFRMKERFWPDWNDCLAHPTS